MKKITIILLGFIALLAVSCDKDDHLALIRANMCMIYHRRIYLWMR